MIVQVNRLPPDLPAPPGAVVAALRSLADAGRIPPDVMPRLCVHLDWVQYKENFREPVLLRSTLRDGAPLPGLELAVDLRQLRRDTLEDWLAAPFEGAHAAAGGVAPLETFGPASASIIWRFNRLYWQFLSHWERAAGRSYEQSLPSGGSDAHNREAIRDSVLAFRERLGRLDARGELPRELFVLEIAVGTGERAQQWLDCLQELDRERGTAYYPKIRFLLADSSVTSLDRAMHRMESHRAVTSFLPVDARNPLTPLSFLRGQVLDIHLTNVYDNLPADEIAVRDGRWRRVEVRAFLREADVAAITRKYDAGPLDRAIARLLETGPDMFAEAAGLNFWRDVWAALRLEERLIAVEDLDAPPLPAGLDASLVERLAGNGAGRFHLSTGAVESFTRTLPLLHPQGRLEVQDIFVVDPAGYSQGFRGPGKLDGSVVQWVNGALLAEVGRRSGYTVRFEPFRRRPGSATSILYATPRETAITP